MYKIVTNKLATLLVAVAFIAVTFSCFSMMSNTTMTHASEMNTVCEIAMTIASTTLVQTGLFLLLVVATVAVGSSIGLFTIPTIVLLRASRWVTTGDFIRQGEYSYLFHFFSSGLIHTKLY